MAAVDSEEMMKELLSKENFDFQFDTGFNKLLRFDNKSEFINMAIMHYVFYTVYTELMQLRSGLISTLCFDQLASNHPHILWYLLASSNTQPPLTATKLQDMFDVHYSVLGSNQRILEETVVMYFYMFYSSM